MRTSYVIAAATLSVTLAFAPQWAAKADSSPFALVQSIETHQVTYAITLSPDGKHVAVGGDHILILDTSSGRKLRSMEDSGGYVTALRFSPGGAQLASGSELDPTDSYSASGTLTVWNASTGRKVRTFDQNDHWCVGFSADGNQALGASRASGLNAWNVRTGRKELHIDGVKDQFCVSRDGKTIVGVRKQHAVVFNARTGKELKSWAVPKAIYLSLSPDGSTLAVLCGGSMPGEAVQDPNHVVWFQLWNIQTKALLKNVYLKADEPRSIVYSPDGKYVYIATESLSAVDAQGKLLNPGGGAVDAYDVATGQLQCLGAFKENAESVSTSADGKTVAAVNDAGDLKIWQVR